MASLAKGGDNKLTSLTKMFEKPNGEIWGHAHPDLQEVSNVTGCRMYFTPAKYWPKDLAARYFDNKTIFGMLRDPYERLVAQFRGNFESYGGGFDKEAREKCDVNSAIKKKMLSIRDSASAFMEDCAFLPQAEYFD